MSLLDLDTPRQLQPAVTQRDVEAEVAKCVGGVLSPLLANVALSVLDEHFAKIPGGPQTSTKRRFTRRQKGLPNYRLIRYADDFVVLVSGTRAHTEALLPDVARVLSTVGLRLSEEKTLITHIDEGLDFLGWRIQRHQKRGTDRQYVYNYPAKKALRSIKAKTKAICRMNVSLPLAVLLHQLNPVLRGWTAYFRPGVSARAFQYLRMIVWRQVFGWLRRKHPTTGWKELRRRYCDGRWWPGDGQVVLFNPGSVVTTRYRPRGTTIPSPWPGTA
jgi:RNA-directed DNA polymerase